MARALVTLLVFCLLAFLRCSQGKPIPPRQTFAKTTADPTGKYLKGYEEPTSPLDDCSQFCSQSYPQHTYPIPSHHKACVTGCHSAQVDALIAWPFKSSSDLCASACSEAYPGSSEQQYACNTGCDVTTIDSLFPDRGMIYTEVNLNDSAPLALFEQASDLMNFFFNSFFSLAPDVEVLTEHASKMSQLLPSAPMETSVVSYVMDDGELVELREYSFQGGVLVEETPTEVVVDFIEIPIADGDAVAEVSSNSDSQPSKEDEVSGSMDSFYVYYSPNTKERCRWITRRMVASRVLMGISVMLIGVAVLVCCLGVLRKDSSHVTGNKKRKVQTFVQSHTPSTVKVPLDRSSEYRPDHSHLLLPVHIKVGGDKTVEGVMTVIS